MTNLAPFSETSCKCAHSSKSADIQAFPKPLDKLEITYTKSPSGSASERLRKRQRTKYAQQATLTELSQLPSPLKGQYMRALDCGGFISYVDGKLISGYCKSRSCAICNRIRTAKAINTYSPILECEDDLYFVTLTRRAVRAWNLKEQIKDFSRAFSLISKQLNRAAAYHGTAKFTAIRKAECTYKKVKDHYHFHYHIIVRGSYHAYELRNRWINHFGDTVDPKAQDIQKADSGSLKELFKYTTKNIVKAESVEALDTIYQAMHRQKSLQGYGDWYSIKDPEITDLDAVIEVETADETETEEKPEKLPETGFSWIEDSWYNIDTGECVFDWLRGAEMLNMTEPTRPPT